MLNQCGRVPFPPLTRVSDCVAVAVAVAVYIVPLPVNVTGEVTTDALSVDVEYTVPVGAAARPGAKFHTNSSWRVDTQDAYDAMVAGLGYDLHVHPTVPEVARVMQNLTRTNASTLCKGVGLVVKATHMALAHPSTSPMLPFSGFSLNAVMRKTWVQQLESLALSTCQGHEAMTFQQLCVLANKVFGRDVCTTRKISPTKLLWGLNYTWVTSLKDMMRFDVGTYFADVPELPIGVQAEGSQTLNASASVELQLVVDFSEKSLVPRLTLETANMTFGADFNVHGDVRAWYVLRVAVSARLPPIAHRAHRVTNRFGPLSVQFAKASAKLGPFAPAKLTVSLNRPLHADGSPCGSADIELASGCKVPSVDAVHAFAKIAQAHHDAASAQHLANVEQLMGSSGDNLQPEQREAFALALGNDASLAKAARAVAEAGTLPPLEVNVSLVGEATFFAQLSVPDSPYCVVNVTIPSIEALFVHGVHAAITFQPNCNGGLGHTLYEALLQHSPLHYLQDTERFVSQMEEGFSSFVAHDLFGPSGGWFSP